MRCQPYRKEICDGAVDDGKKSDFCRYGKSIVARPLFGETPLTESTMDRSLVA